MTTREEDNETAVALLREACSRTSEAFHEPPGLEEPRALRTLGRVLTADAAVDIRPPKPPRGGLRIAPRLPRAAVVAVPAAVAVAAAVVLAAILLGTSSSALAQKFPVFASASAKPARAALEVFREANVRASASRAIHTPAGAGYVTASADDRELCIAVPGSDAALIDAIQAKALSGAGHHLKYVGGCAPFSQAESKGVVLMIPAHGRVELVVVLPAGASAPVVRSASGNPTTLTPKDGTVVTLARTPAVLEYKVEGTRVSTDVEPNAAKSSVLLIPSRER